MAGKDTQPKGGESLRPFSHPFGILSGASYKKIGPPSSIRNIRDQIEIKRWCNPVLSTRRPSLWLRTVWGQNTPSIGSIEIEPS